MISEIILVYSQGSEMSLCCTSSERTLHISDPTNQYYTSKLIIQVRFDVTLKAC